MNTRTTCHILLAVLFLLVLGEPCFSDEIVTLAIMKFENLTGSPSNDWICHGFSETMTTKLSYIGKITLVERAQIGKILDEIKLKGLGLTDPEVPIMVGRITSAKYMILGSIQLYDGNLMINARMVNVETTRIDPDKSMMLRGEMDRIFDLQFELALMMMERINLDLTEEEIERLKVHETSSLRAYEFYQLANAEEDIDRKIAYYEKAIKFDPDYAYAHSNLASVLYSQGFCDDEICGQNIEKALEHADRAIELNDRFPTSYYIRASIHNRLGNAGASRRDFCRFLSFDRASSNLVKQAEFYLESSGADCGTGR